MRFTIRRLRQARQWRSRLRNIIPSSGQGDVLELRVREVCQTSSGGDHVTIYEADIDIVPGEVRVAVTGVDPADAEP